MSTTSGGNVVTPHQQADQLIANKNYAAAIVLLEPVVAANPGDQHGWQLLGTARYRSGALNQAIEAYQHALTLAPNDPIPMYSLAIALKDSGDIDQARNLLAGLLQSDPNFKPARARLAEWAKSDQPAATKSDQPAATNGLPPPSSPDGIVGRVANYQQRIEVDPFITRGQTYIWTFRVERSGQLPVPVEMRAPKITGALVNGDVVEVPGPWQPGQTIRPSKVLNRTTNTMVVAKRWQRRIMLAVIALFVLTFISVAAVLVYRAVTDDSPSTQTSPQTTPGGQGGNGGSGGDGGGGPDVAMSALSLDPETVTVGSASQGTATLSNKAPSDGVVVSLLSSNTDAATVPASVTVSEGATAATFTISTAASSEDAVTISASAGGATRTATLNINPPPDADTVTITRATYQAQTQRLQIDATSSSSDATLSASESSTRKPIGTLSPKGDGTFVLDLTWPSNPQQVTITSSKGGKATGTVAGI
jgi:hypothetical protein